MNLKLLKLTINNFKGIVNHECNFYGGDANIYGMNGTGKTTIKDAFSWLLFGKDSFNRSNFGIKTKDADGNETHHLVHSVEALFSIDGTEIKLKREMKENWVRQRGAANETFQGHETIYYIDDVPKRKKEFDSKVESLIGDKDLFVTISDPMYFNSIMNWKDRRKMLIDICGNVTDEDVINSDPRLAPLTTMLGGKSVDDYREIVRGRMKPINEELKIIPSRIDEAIKAKPIGEDMSYDEEKLAEINEMIDKVTQDKLMILNGGATTELKLKLTEVLGERAKIENTVFTSATIEKQKESTQSALNQTELKITQLKNKIESLKVSKTNNSLERDILRERYNSIDAETYNQDENICPTCNQELPPEQIEKAIKQFNLDKSKKLENLSVQGENLMALFVDYDNELKKTKELLSIHLESHESIAKDLEVINASFEKAKESFEKKKEQSLNENSKVIASIEEQIKIAQNDVSSLVEKKERQLESLKEQKKPYEIKIAMKETIERQDKRIAELAEKEKELINEYGTLEKGLYLTDLFIKTKVSLLSKKINSHFAICTFKLFDEQINGGLKECCEVTVDGVPYSDLNNAMRINAGLDIINTLCEHYEISAPIIIDNCEAINKVFKTTSQQIKLYVTNTDEELRVEPIV